MKMSSNQNLRQPRSNRNRANPRPLDISYSNIRGLRTNFAAVQSFLDPRWQSHRRGPIVSLLSVCLSVRPSVTHSSQDLFITFF